MLNYSPARVTLVPQPVTDVAGILRPNILREYLAVGVKCRLKPSKFIG